MIIIIKKNADEAQVENLKTLLRSKHIEPHSMRTIPMIMCTIMMNSLTTKTLTIF